MKKKRLNDVFFVLILLFAIGFGINFVVAQASGDTCTDSDGGKDYYVKGTVELTHGSDRPTFLNDYCTSWLGGGSSAMVNEGPYLSEVYCKNETYAIGEGYDCPHGCSDGACIGEPCTTPGTLSEDGTQYCDTDGVFKPLIPDDEDCANDYECANQSCVEGICEGKYEPFGGDQRSFIQRIIDFLDGKNCYPAGEDDCADDGKLIRTCGSEFTWESIDAYVDGRCGYTKPENGNGGGGGGGCTPRWVCTNWSNQAEFCGTRICTDEKNCGKTHNKPIETKACPGINPYCGDGVCDSGESYSTCASDCPAPIDPCNHNGKCEPELGESSFNCDDCVPVETKPKWWILWLLIILILLAIVTIIALIYFRRKREKEEQEAAAMKKTTKPFPPSGRFGMPGPGIVRKPIAMRNTTLPYAKPKAATRTARTAARTSVR